MENQELITLLYEQILAHYNKDELNTLVSIKLGIDYDNLQGNTRSAKARELVLYCERGLMCDPGDDLEPLFP